jgi:carboxyl-terminal processing protease
MNRLTKLTVVALSLVVFSYASLGYVLRKTDDEKSYRSLTVYGEVLQRIQEEYVEEPNMAKVTAGALHGLLESLDSMSSYLSPQEYTEYKKQVAARTQGQVGIALSKGGGYVRVVSTLPDSPAEKAGLLTGDILESIAGFATREMSIGQAMNLIDGPAGSTVKVSVIRPSRGLTPEEVTVTRLGITQTHVTMTKIAPDIAYLRIPALEKGVADEVRTKLVDADHQGLRKAVLDLRGCAVGDDAEGIAVARLFLASGTIATLKGQMVTKQDFAADPSKVVWKNPVSILVSNATSGAAELVATGIISNHRGDVVGERTYGTASEQKLIEFDDGSAVFLTDAFYYTPEGKAIPEDGVTPTTPVPLTSDDAVSFSRAENPPAIPASPADDAVLSKALDLLNNAHKVAERHVPNNPRRVHTLWPVQA